jgi:hypothetical protein
MLLAISYTIESLLGFTPHALSAAAAVYWRRKNRTSQLFGKLKPMGRPL